MTQANDAPGIEHQWPYGSGAATLGMYASDILYDLCNLPSLPVTERPRWEVTDARALQGHFNMEEVMADAFTDLTITRDQIEILDDLVTRYHVSLPMDEAEREWLFTECNGLAVPEHLRAIRRQEVTLVSRGLRRVIYGRDLLRRWSAWRRDADEFASRGTVGIARETLRELIETVSPDLGLPETYLAHRNDPGASIDSASATS
jgi:hypothetical protein